MINYDKWNNSAYNYNYSSYDTENNCNNDMIVIDNQIIYYCNNKDYNKFNKKNNNNRHSDRSMEV